jgi:hypothetical protein
MKDAPFVEAPISPGTSDPEAQAARKRLEAVLAELNPAGGKAEPPLDAAKAAKKAARKAAAKKKQAGL